MESLYRDRPFTGVMVLENDVNVLGEHLFDKFQVHASSNVFEKKAYTVSLLRNVGHSERLPVGHN
nr:hypothetical protein [Cytophagales bacterium]